jgi:hypothetical protein
LVPPQADALTTGLEDTVTPRMQIVHSERLTV